MSQDSKQTAGQFVDRIEAARREIVGALRLAEQMSDASVVVRVKNVLSDVDDIRGQVNTRLGHVTG